MNLLIENAVQREPFFEKNVVRLVIALVIWVVVFFLAYIFYTLNSKEEAAVVQNNVLQQKKLDALYASEAVPVLPKSSSIPDATFSELSADGISGYILFTGLSKDKPGSTNRIYYTDATQTHSRTYSLLPDLVQYSAFVEPFDVNLPQEFFADVMHLPLSQLSSGKQKQKHSVQKYDMTDGSLKGYDSIGGVYVQDLNWSEAARKLAYSRLLTQPESYADLVPIDNWEVITSDTDRDLITGGVKGAVQPTWSPDGSKMIVLKRDGLYVYDEFSKTETRVVTVSDGQVLATSMLDLSPDGSHLVWTTSKAGVISVSKITSWDPFVLGEIMRITAGETEFYQPQFSPDGKYYAVLAIDSLKKGESERKNPRIEIRATGSDEVVRAYEVGEFDFNSFFIDTWIELLPEAVTSNE